jgi:Bacterial transcriptional activator domain
VEQDDRPAASDIAAGHRTGQYEALCAEGRRGLANGDAARARERLCPAFGHWRGEPLADFAYEPFAQSVVARLQEARLAVLADRIKPFGSSRQITQAMGKLLIIR